MCRSASWPAPRIPKPRRAGWIPTPHWTLSAGCSASSPTPIWWSWSHWTRSGRSGSGLPPRPRMLRSPSASPPAWTPPPGGGGQNGSVSLALIPTQVPAPLCQTHPHQHHIPHTDPVVVYTHQGVDSLFGWFEEVELNFRATSPGWPKQITYRKHAPKVCVHLFQGQDEDQIWIIWAFLVQFWLRIERRENGKFDFLGSLGWVQIWWGGKLETLLGQIGPYLRKYNCLVKEVQMKCSILYGCLNHSISSLIFKKNFNVFRWGECLGYMWDFQKVPVFGSLCIGRLHSGFSNHRELHGDAARKWDWEGVPRVRPSHRPLLCLSAHDPQKHPACWLYRSRAPPGACLHPHSCGYSCVWLQTTKEVKKS